MYQYSLNFFMRMFNDCILNSRETGPGAESAGEIERPRAVRRRHADARSVSGSKSATSRLGNISDEESDDEEVKDSKRAKALDDRLQSLMRYTTRFMFENVCRALFEEHKLLYSMLCTHPARGGAHRDAKEWAASSARASDESKLPPKPETASTSSQWVLAHLHDPRARAEGALRVLPPRWRRRLGVEHRAVDAEEPFPFRDLPGAPRRATRSPTSSGCSSSRPSAEKIVECIGSSTSRRRWGEEYTEQPPLDLDKVFPDTDCRTPIVFVLSAGADPMSTILRFATEGLGTGRRCTPSRSGRARGRSRRR